MFLARPDRVITTRPHIGTRSLSLILHLAIALTTREMKRSPWVRD